MKEYTEKELRWLMLILSKVTYNLTESPADFQLGQRVLKKTMENIDSLKNADISAMAGKQDVGQKAGDKKNG